MVGFGGQPWSFLSTFVDIAVRCCDVRPDVRNARSRRSVAMCKRDATNMQLEMPELARVFEWAGVIRHCLRCSRRASQSVYML